MNNNSEYKKIASYEAKKGEFNHCLLLYSGGLDTSVMVKWIQDEYKCQISTLTIDIGQTVDELNKIKQKALKLGAKNAVIYDAKDEFADIILSEAIKANANYQGGYALGCPLGRIIISKIAVKIAQKYDIEASRAHAEALNRIKILNNLELKKICRALRDLENQFKQGKLKISISDEDCHTVIENYLIKKIGDTGKKIHTGRSRNDQVLTAIRLYIKNNLRYTQKQTQALAINFIKLAKKYRLFPMPGYSHTQQAMLSSVGHYFAAFAESLLDDASLLGSIYSHLDKNPLGSAAGFGVSLPLDRSFTTKKLKFKDTQINSLYCQNSRGKFESIFLEGLSQVMLTLNKFANDIIIFSSREFDFFSVQTNITTGSSIMPQKHNLDGLEIMRGNTSIVISHQLTVKNLSQNLLSGYNRDLQLIKKPLIESVNITQNSIRIASIYLNGITPNKKILEKQIKKDIFAADVANELVKKDNIPFRDAYKRALEKLDNTEINISKNLVSKISLGAPGNLGLNRYSNRLKKKL